MTGTFDSPYDPHHWFNLVFPERHMITAHINGKMLAWARERAGIDLDHLSKGAVTVKKLKAWESGSELPSETQATALAQRLGISYAMLFMPEVPQPDDPQIPDLRTLSGQSIRNPSLDFRDVLNTALIRQDWLREERTAQQSAHLEYVGRFSLSSDPNAVAADMRIVLDLAPQDRRECADYEAFIKHLVTRAEDIGISVFRNALVGNDTHRRLKVAEFRGFALSDTLAPVVFINDADAKAAQVFTVAHELAHLWIGADGVSDRTPNTQKDSTNAIELFCDRVAAEVLVPEAEFGRVWKGGPTLATARSVASHFRVSTLVALRRAKDLNRVSFSDFLEAVNAEYDRFREIDLKKREKQKEKKKGGGNFWASFDIRNGKVLNRAVATALRDNRTTFTEASTLLGLNIGSTVRYLNRVGDQ